jgi:hypothetical protein
VYDYETERAKILEELEWPTVWICILTFSF